MQPCCTATRFYDFSHEAVQLNHRDPKSQCKPKRGNDAHATMMNTIKYLYNQASVTWQYSDEVPARWKHLLGWVVLNQRSEHLRTPNMTIKACYDFCLLSMGVYLTMSRSKYIAFLFSHYPLFKVLPLPFGLASTYSSHSRAFIVSASAFS